MEGSEKGTPLSSVSAGGAVSEQLESDNQLQPDSNNEGVHPTSTLSGDSNSAVGQWDRGSETQRAVNPHWVETKKVILEILSATQKMEGLLVGQVDRRGVVAWKEKERRASREGTKVAGVDACVIVCLAECAWP